MTGEKLEEKIVLPDNPTQAPGMKKLFPVRRKPLIQSSAWLGMIVFLLALPAAIAGEAALETLRGSWVRPDGGYKLVVESVAEDGTARVEYFNPNPIKVAVAKAALKEGKATLFVEFDDVNYKGSKYNLALSPDQKQLTGEYFQATRNETYSILFDRVP